MQSGLLPRCVVLSTVVWILLLAWAGVACAAEFTVTSTGDQADAAVGSGGCKTAAGTCTLRAAIEESNAAASVEGNTIKAEFPTFDGQLSSTIELGSPLPTITQKVKVEGSLSPYQCETAYYAVPGPCAGVDGPAGGTAFRISAKGVDLTGFAISDAKTAVEVVNGPGLFMWNNWVGLKLDGSAGPVETGIRVDQNSNGVRIGGVYSPARNIFANDTGVGVNIDGADDAEVLDNGFGVLPDGASPAPNGTNIEIGDAVSGENRTARANWIGRRLEAEEIASTICDGGCNVIASALGSGIDLGGEGVDEEPATGSTRIFGNYIGLDAFGTALPNAQAGVLVGSAIGTRIGGPLPGDRNVVDGGVDGVLAGPGGGELVIEGNWIGLDPTGTVTLNPPSAAGIAVTGGSDVEVFENRLSMVTGTSIEAAAYQSLIRGNVIGEGVTGTQLPGGAVGVVLPGPCGACALVFNNSISNASEFGVWVEGSWNHLYGNDIEQSGGPGIYIEEPGIFGGVWGTVVGGDTASEENSISGSGGPAIEIVAGQEYNSTRKNVVARNNGSSNTGPFIALVNGPNNSISNNGIQPPLFSTSAEFGATGTGAKPGAVIRVFRKAGSSPGEIEAFLAETRADEEGDWIVTYPSPVPAGTMVAASQSTEEDVNFEFADGTSEFAFATTTAPPGTGGGDSGGTAGTTIPKGDVQHPAPPQTVIVRGPSTRSRATVARFRFRSDEPFPGFRCALDDGPVTSCASPKTYRGLKPGKHVFRVWAVSGAGEQDPTPARWSFWLERRRRTVG